MGDGRPILRQPHGPNFVGRSTFYVKYQTAELDEQMARMDQLSDGKLMRIAEGRQPKDVQRMSKLLVRLPQGRREKFRIGTHYFCSCSLDDLADVRQVQRRPSGYATWFG